MAMRFWYHSMIVLSDMPDYAASIRSQLRKAVRSDSEVVLHGFAPGSFRASYPGPDVAFNFIYGIHSLQFVLAALEAERQGYDAFVMGNLGSPMVREIRSLVDISVVGYGDAGARLSGLYGRRFGLLVFNVERMESLPDRYRDWGLADSFVGARPAGVPMSEVAQAHADPSRRAAVVRKVVAAGERLVEECGADVIMPGEMPLNLLLADAGISQIAGATVLDGLAVMMKTAEMMVDLRRACGMNASRRGYYHVKPPSERLREILDFYGLAHLQEKLSAAFPEI